MSFKQRHEGKSLPPMESGEQAVSDFEPESIPVSIKGIVIPLTEREALGIVGQIASVLQMRREGVFCNEQ